MRLSKSEFQFRQCSVAELNDILLLQKETIASLPSPEILRENTAEMLSECLAPPHYTVGAWYNGVFVGFSVLYYPHDDAENLSLSLEGVDLTGLKTANNKLCIVREGYRGNALQYHLGKMLEQHAKNSGTNLLCATVSPKNQYSINNMLRLGFRYNRTLMKYGFERNLYYKFI